MTLPGLLAVLVIVLAGIGLITTGVLLLRRRGDWLACGMGVVACIIAVTWWVALIVAWIHRMDPSPASVVRPARGSRTGSLRLLGDHACRVRCRGGEQQPRQARLGACDPRSQHRRRAHLLFRPTDAQAARPAEPISGVDARALHHIALSPSPCVARTNALRGRNTRPTCNGLRRT